MVKVSWWRFSLGARLVSTTELLLVVGSLSGCSTSAPDGSSAAAPTIDPSSNVVESSSELAGTTTPAAAATGGSSAGEPTTPQDPVSTKTNSEVTNGPATPSAAPRTKPDNGEPEKISFDDLNCGMQADIVFRDWMLTERVKQLEKRRVKIAGYMHPDAKQQGITEFVLLRNTECKFGPMGQADHLIRVTLKPGVTTRFSPQPVEVIGVITVNPFTGPDQLTWSIFDLEGDTVGPVRR